MGKQEKHHPFRNIQIHPNIYQKKTQIAVVFDAIEIFHTAGNI